MNTSANVKSSRQRRHARAIGVMKRAEALHLPKAYTAFWQGFAAEIVSRDDIDDSEAAGIEASAILVVIAADAAERLADVHRVLMEREEPNRADRRALIVEDMVNEFRRVLTACVESNTPFDHLMDEEAENLMDEEASGEVDFAAMFREAVSRVKADAAEAQDSSGQADHFADALAAQVRAHTERAVADAAATGTAWTRTNPDGSVDNIAPSDVHPRAEETSPAPEPAETPDAGKANPMPRTTAAAQGALDALAAEQAAKPKVYRHDEHMPAGGPVVTRIETEGERG